MALRKYTTFALPNDLVQRLDDFLEGNTWGFRTRGEVLAASLRDFLMHNAAGASINKPPSRTRGPRRRGPRGKRKTEE